VLFVDADMAGGEVHAFAGGSAAVFSARAPGKTSPNEDAAALLPIGSESGVIVIADGIGGGRLGEEAARATIRIVSEAISAALESGALLRTGIIDGIERANQAVLDLGVGAGTTIAAVEIQGKTARPYHVGDSVILATGQRGRVKWQSICHSPIGYAIEAGVLAEHEALLHEDRHLVSNVVGSARMRIDLGPLIELAPYDTVLLATDGLADNLRTEEIIDLVRKGPLESASELLIEKTRERMAGAGADEPSKPDDLTFVLYRP